MLKKAGLEEAWREVRRNGLALMRFCAADPEQRREMILNDEQLWHAVQRMLLTHNPDMDQMERKTLLLWLDEIFHLLESGETDFEVIAAGPRYHRYDLTDINPLLDFLCGAVTKENLGSHHYSEYADKLLDTVNQFRLAGINDAERLMRRLIKARATGLSLMSLKDIHTSVYSVRDETLDQLLLEKYGLEYYDLQERGRRAAEALGFGKSPLFNFD